MTNKQKNVVIKKKKGYYNTLTGKYVSESYAKRLNSYFKRNPKANLYRAGGHGFYSLDKPLSEHSESVRKLAYGEKTQLVKTKSKKKKTVYYAPLKKDIVEQDELKKFKNLDYKTRNNGFVELYRLTRDRDNIYHIITWDVNKSFHSGAVAEIWKENNRVVYKNFVDRLFRLAKKHKLSNEPYAYGHISFYSYSKYDGREYGRTFGMVLVRKGAKQYFINDYDKLIDNLVIDKLKNDSYRSVAILRICFYLTESKKKASNISKVISQYRIGVNRTPFKEKK